MIAGTLVLLATVDAQAATDPRARLVLKPWIDRVHPLYGGTEGGTRINIHGQNFMQLELNSQMQVLVEGIDMLPHPHE